MIVQTIAVVEITDDEFNVTTFEENDLEGALKLFSECAIEHGALPEDVEQSFIIDGDDGYFEQGDYQLFLRKSE